MFSVVLEDIFRVIWIEFVAVTRKLVLSIDVHFGRRRGKFWKQGV